MTKHKQTWWDKEIKARFNEFKSWVGSPTEPSKVWARNYINSTEAKSVIDIGCGMCDEYFVYKDLFPGIDWQGVEPSEFLFNKANEKDIPVVQFEGDDINFRDGMFDVAYSRHVLEHQRDYKPILSEMIRIASQVVIHVFFISPKEEKIINYDEKQNLYHNTFDRNEIEAYLILHEKVKSWEWISIPKAPTEEALVVNLKDTNQFRKNWYNKSVVE